MSLDSSGDRAYQLDSSTEPSSSSDRGEEDFEVVDYFDASENMSEPKRTMHYTLRRTVKPSSSNVQDNKPNDVKRVAGVGNPQTAQNYTRSLIPGSVQNAGNGSGGLRQPASVAHSRDIGASKDAVKQIENSLKTAESGVKGRDGGDKGSIPFEHEDGDELMEDVVETGQTDLEVLRQKIESLDREKAEQAEKFLAFRRKAESDQKELDQMRAADEKNALHISVCEDQIKTLEAVKRDFAAEKIDLEHQLSAARASEESYKAQAEILQGDKTTLLEERARLDESLNKQRATGSKDREFRAQLEADKKKISHKYRELEKRNNSLVAQVRNIQDKAFSSMESARFMPDSISSIDQKFTDILNDIKRWSKTHSKISTLTTTDMERLLRPRGCLGPRERLLDVLEHANTAKGRAAPIWLFLSSAVATDAFRQIAGNPFFAFHEEDFDKEEALVLRDAEALQHLLRLIDQNDEAGANVWRCSLIRLLDPPVPANNSAVGGIKNLAATCRSAAAKRLAEQCVGELLDVFILKEDANAAAVELAAIFQGCADFCWKLWAQKTRISVLTFDETMKAEGEVVYQHQSEHLQLHALHNGEVSDDPTALDGRKAVMLTSPAIVAAGTPEGKDYQQVRTVWKKAVAWIE